MTSAVLSPDLRERAADRGRRLLGVLRQPSLILSYLFVLVVLAAAALPFLFTPLDPLAHDYSVILQPPGPGHPFGTDEYGRDQFARAVYGTANSLQAAVLAILIGLVSGSLLGLVAGIRGGLVDNATMRVVDIMLAVPNLIISLAIVTALGRGSLNIAIAIGVNSTAGFARLMRAEVLKVRNSVFVEASAFSGHSGAYRVLRHVIPNASTSVLAAATMDVGSAILSVAALSFLGFGAPPPTPEWGALVAEGRNFLASSWWLTTMPGLVIVATVLSVYRIGRSFNQGRTSVVS